MSAFSETNNQSIEPGAPSNTEQVARSPSVSASFSGKMESFISATRQLEESLDLEKKKSQKLKKDYAHAYSTYEKMLQEFQSRVREYEINETRLKTKLAERETTSERATTQLKELSAEEKKIRSELTHYKAAWADVLTREKEAKKVLVEIHQLQRKYKESEALCLSLQQQVAAEKSKREQMERHAQGYQRELQNTLVRIHSSESKYNEMTKELQAVSQVKRNADEEISKLENTMKERFKWEFATERERVKAELEKDSVLDRERFREISRKTARADLDKAIATERERSKRAQEQLQDEFKALRDSQNSARQELLKNQGTLQQELSHAKQEAEVLKQEYSKFKESTNEKLKQKDVEKEELQAQIKELSKPVQAIRKEMEKEVEARTREIGSKNQTVVEEYQTETATLKMALNAEMERAESLKKSLIEVKTRFDREMHGLEKEFKACLSEEQLKNMLALKDAELLEIAEQLNAGTVAPDAMSALVESHKNTKRERETVLERLKASEAFTDYLVGRIDYATGLNTIVAQADEEI